MKASRVYSSNVQVQMSPLQIYLFLLLNRCLGIQFLILEIRDNPRLASIQLVTIRTSKKHIIQDEKIISGANNPQKAKTKS